MAVFERGCRCFFPCARKNDNDGMVPLSTRRGVGAPPGPPPTSASAKGKAKAKAKAPPPPPPKKDPLQPRNSVSNWVGAQPAEGFKSARIVNWNPIRKEDLLLGSVWKQVNESLEQRGNEQLLPEAFLNKAFMQDVNKKRTSVESTTRAKRQSFLDRSKQATERLLPPKEALVADLLYNQLSKAGFADRKQLEFALGLSAKRDGGTQDGAGKKKKDTDADGADGHNSGSDDSGSFCSTHTNNSDDSDADRESSESEPDPETRDGAGPDEHSLQTLLSLLRLADVIEDRLKLIKPEATMTLAGPELLLKQLVSQGGSAAAVRLRVQTALKVRCFPKEADTLERTMRSGIMAAKGIMNSKALPVLLEGVLLLGNYVNSSSTALGSATGVTLDSLAKLQHTRVVAMASTAESDASDLESSASETNALVLLIKQLRKSQGKGWLSTLISDLSGCRVARELECIMSSTTVQSLAAHVSAIEDCLRQCSASGDEGHPGSFQARLTRFLGYASPRLSMLRSLEQDLQSTTVTMRRHFAESATSPLPAMLRNFAGLLDVLETIKSTPRRKS